MSSLSLLVTTACLLGCRDNPASARPPEPGVTGGGRFVATVVCAVDVKERRTACELASEGETEDDAGARFLVIRDAQAMVQTGEDAYTPADSTYRLNLRIINNGPSDLGTRDGTAVTGIKAFIPVNIMGYAGRPPGDTTRPGAFLVRPMPNQNQLVHARNPDGRMAFTGPDQPYWSYAQKLAPGETSQWREWRFTVDPSVSHFYFAVSVFAAAPGEPAVPETAPNGWLIPMDSVRALYSLQNAIVEHPRMSGPYPRNIVLLYFRPGSTMDERQAALESVNATVIGGDGFFYLAQLKDDGREELLWRALDRLATLPQIELADPDIRGNIGPMYQIPHDGSGWGRQDWRIESDSASGANWGPEAIAAPLAWGCERGNNLARVAVVDVEANHARWVTSIINSPVNDSVGIAGILWHGQVTTSDASRGGAATDRTALAANLHADLRDAVANRADVINISVGMTYFRQALVSGVPTLVQRLPRNDSADAQIARRRAAQIGLLLRTAEQQHNHLPLYVVAAGNYQMDARLTGYPQLVGDTAIGRRVIVVAGSDSNRVSPTERRLWANSGDSLSPGSSYGNLVTVAAPGASLVGMSGGTVSRIQGTSFAAPHVSAVAGLMKAFDPRLPADSIKSLLLAGASAGGRTSGGFPFLNAYEALKDVARRNGAPVCGNRIWTDAADIYVERGPRGAETAEKVAAVPSDTVRWLDVLHGGTIRFGGFGDYMERRASFQRPGGTWSAQATANPWSFPVPSSNASEMSHRAWSHSGDTVTAVFLNRSTPSATVELRPVRAGAFPSATVLNNAVLAARSPGSWSEVCVRDLLIGGQRDCDAWAQIGSGDTIIGIPFVYSPGGRRLYYAVNRGAYSVSLNDWVPCGGGPTDRRCADRTHQLESRGADFYEVALPGGVIRKLWSEADGNLEGIQVAEGDERVGFQRVQTRRDWIVGIIGDGPAEGSKQVLRDERACTVHVRATRTGAAVPAYGSARCDANTLVTFAP